MQFLLPLSFLQTQKFTQHFSVFSHVAEGTIICTIKGFFSWTKAWKKTSIRHVGWNRWLGGLVTSHDHERRGRHGSIPPSSLHHRQDCRWMDEQRASLKHDSRATSNIHWPLFHLLQTSSNIFQCAYSWTNSSTWTSCRKQLNSERTALVCSNLHRAPGFWSLMHLHRCYDITTPHSRRSMQRQTPNFERKKIYCCCKATNVFSVLAVWTHAWRDKRCIDRPTAIANPQQNRRH